MNTWRAIVFALVWVAFCLPILLQWLTQPALLQRRLRGGPLFEKQASQKLITPLLVLCILALAAVSALDNVSGWSHVPVFFVLIGDVVVASGLTLSFLVFRVNPFAAAAVTVEPGQAVISTGPYALVRHPLYSGGLLVFLGIPLALGSWWGLVLFAPILALIIWRLTNEETYLSTHLPGYLEYRARVTHRLIPSLW
jgi:protein-S-isoprenylcysteine O-methyltransferase Ste14